MRSISAYLSGLLTGLVLLFFQVLLSRPPPAPGPLAASESLVETRREVSADPAGTGASRGRPPQVERSASPPVAPPGHGAPLSGPVELAGLLEARDLPALRGEIERLLHAGAGGYQVLLDFLRAQAEPPRLGLGRDGPLGPLLLSIALRNEERAAECCKFLLARLRRHEDSAVQRHLLRFLPVFVACARDEGPALRMVLAEVLLADIARPDAAMEGREGEPAKHGPNPTGHAGDDSSAVRSLETIEELGIELIAEDLEPALSDPAKKQLHPLILQKLATHGDDDSLEAIFRHIERLERGDPLLLAQPFEALAQVPGPRARAYLEGCLGSPLQGVRQAATLAYFSTRRGAESLPVAREFLDSEIVPAQKTALVWRVRASSPEVFAAMEKDLNSFQPEVAKAVQMAALRRRVGTGAARSIDHPLDR